MAFFLFFKRVFYDKCKWIGVWSFGASFQWIAVPLHLKKRPLWFHFSEQRINSIFCIQFLVNFNPSQFMQVHIPGIFSKAFIKVHLNEIGTSVVQFLRAHCYNTALKATLSGLLEKNWEAIWHHAIPLIWYKSKSTLKAARTDTQCVCGRRVMFN